MKLAVSNIAWEKHDDSHILKLLRDNGVLGIEVAPTKIWPKWEGANNKSAKEYKIKMEDEGFELPALQAILFGRPELQVFDKSSHSDFFEHIKLVAEVANGLGCKTLVFGSPKNRKRGQLTYSEAMKLAEEFFYKLGAICLAQDCCIGIEHNPIEYGCDFITNVLDAKEIVDNVAHAGFKLHIDTAGLEMCGGNNLDTLKKAGDFIHFHISETLLCPISEGNIDHLTLIKYLNDINYENWISIEMRIPDHISILEESIRKIKRLI